MFNMFCVVGKVNNIDLKDDICRFTLRVPRSFKSKDGEYEEDLITIQVFGNLSYALNEYCKTGYLVGVKGRIQGSNVLVAERVAFLSSRSKN